MKLITSNRIAWTAQIAAIVIMGQSLFFKFTAHPASVAIFTDIGLEPFGRYFTGIVEVLAIALLLRKNLSAYGAIIGLGTMTGALAGHFTQIGWAGERGELGMLAVIVWIACATVIAIRRQQLPLHLLSRPKPSPAK